MANEDREMAGKTVYELCFLVLPSIPEDELLEFTSSIRKVISKYSGHEIEAEEPVKHPLAYSMSKTVGASRYTVNDAYIGWIKFESDVSSALNIKSEVEKMPEILRFILVKAPRKTTFTFAKARFSMRKAEEPESEVSDEKPIEEEVVVE